jgi:hypothetical protein
MHERKNEKTAAILTINDAPDMSIAGRKMVARELRRQINLFVVHGELYSRRFHYRYLYQEGDYATQKGHK